LLPRTGCGDSIAKPSSPAQASATTRTCQLAANPDPVSGPRADVSAAGADTIGKPAPAQAPKTTRTRELAANSDTFPDPRSHDPAAGPECVARERAAGPECVMHAG
jgi:hypothetical protein